jgi:hypothetical protein
MSPTPEDTQAERESQRAVEILRSIERVRAPASLRHTVEAMTAEAARTSTGRRRGRPMRGRLRLAGAFALATIALVAITLALSSGGTGGTPTVLQAARVGLETATQTAPSESPGNPHQLAISAAGIPYPYWGGSLGWTATGVRTDRVDGRTLTTVFYADRRDRRIAYTIVSGGALVLPVGSTVVDRSARFRLLNTSGFIAVTWREAGHTCILTARAVDAPTLVRLAAWQRA